MPSPSRPGAAPRTAGRGTHVRFAGRYRFPVSTHEVWRELAPTERFGRWWTWFTDLETTGPRLASGVSLTGTVTPPVPYRLRITVHLHDVVPAERMVATVSGDLEGPAQLDFFPLPDGCEIAVAWDVEMLQPAMRLAVRVARPLLLWGHDRVVDHTLARFRQRLDGVTAAAR